VATNAVAAQDGTGVVGQCNDERQEMLEERELRSSLGRVQLSEPSVAGEGVAGVAVDHHEPPFDKGACCRAASGPRSAQRAVGLATEPAVQPGLVTGKGTVTRLPCGAGRRLRRLGERVGGAGDLCG
jgi:hypothetical protein